MGPVTLAMHNIAHRPMMKRKGLDRIIINLGSATLGFAPDIFCTSFVDASQCAFRFKFNDEVSARFDFELLPKVGDQLKK